jgi:hypothetical protein
VIGQKQNRCPTAMPESCRKRGSNKLASDTPRLRPPFNGRSARVKSQRFPSHQKYLRNFAVRQAQRRLLPAQESQSDLKVRQNFSRLCSLRNSARPALIQQRSAHLSNRCDALAVKLDDDVTRQEAPLLGGRSGNNLPVQKSQE